MNYCQNDTTTLAGGKTEHRCKVCGMVLVTNRPRLMRRCLIQPNGGEAPSLPTNISVNDISPGNQEPNQLKRLFNFSKAIVKHVSRGMKVCTEEQIEERYNICKGCELFKILNEETGAGVCSHTNCGCNVNKESKFLNKVAWAEQQCPINKWPKIE